MLSSDCMRSCGNRAIKLRLCICFGILVFLGSGHFPAQTERVTAFLSCTPIQTKNIPHSYSIAKLKCDSILQTSFLRTRWPRLTVKSPAMSSKGSSNSIKSQQFAARLKLLKVGELRQLLAQVEHATPPAPRPLRTCAPPPLLPTSSPALPPTPPPTPQLRPRRLLAPGFAGASARGRPR